MIHFELRNSLGCNYDGGNVLDTLIEQRYDNWTC